MKKIATVRKEKDLQIVYGKNHPINFSFAFSQKMILKSFRVNRKLILVGKSKTNNPKP